MGKSSLKQLIEKMQTLKTEHLGKLKGGFVNPSTNQNCTNEKSCIGSENTGTCKNLGFCYY